MNSETAMHATLRRLANRFHRGILDQAERHQEQLLREADRSRTLAGQACLLSRSLAVDTPLHHAALRVHSQFGDDGVIAHLLDHVPIQNDVFVEIGVEDYRESNTRFLLETRNWAGVAIDRHDDHISLSERWGLLGRHQFDPVQATVTRENIGMLLERVGCAGDVGLLSLDIDGVDYWVLDEALRVSSPRIVIAEYNSTFGRDRRVSVPYDPDFDRSRAHHSNLYFGASVAAFDHLARSHGYAIVGSNDAGNNLFMVRDDVAGGLPRPGTDAWVESRFRESRDEAGRNTYVSSHADRRRIIAHLPLIDVATDARITVGDL